MDVHTQGESKGGQPVARPTGIITSSLKVLAVPVKRAVASSTTKRAVVSSVVLSALVFLSVAAAILAYAIFYYLYVPQIGFEKQVWLQYGFVFRLFRLSGGETLLCAYSDMAKHRMA